MTCLRTVGNTTGTAGVPPGADELCDRVADQIMFDVGGKADAGTIVSDLLSATFHALRRNGQIKSTHDQFDLITADARRRAEEQLASIVEGAVDFHQTVEAAVAATVEMINTLPGEKRE